MIKHKCTAELSINQRIRTVQTWWGVWVKDRTGRVHKTYHARVYDDGSIQCWPTVDQDVSFGWSKGGYEILHKTPEVSP